MTKKRKKFEQLNSYNYDWKDKSVKLTFKLDGCSVGITDHTGRKIDIGSLDEEDFMSRIFELIGWYKYLKTKQSNDKKVSG